MRRSLIGGIALLLAFAASAHAQTKAQADKLSDYLYKAAEDISQVTINLIEMERGMQPPDDFHTSSVYEVAKNAQGSYDKLHIVVTIYSMMKDSRDQATVKKYIQPLAKHAIAASNSAISTANRSLGGLKSPAAIAEVQKVRDILQRVRDEIQRSVPGG